MKTIIFHSLQIALTVSCVFSCTNKKNQVQLENELKSLDLNRGDIALCGSENGKFGTVEFSLSCSEKVRANFDLATALLHSFEYPEAEKVFAKVIDEDPNCIMAYWGAAMCNFHPLWEIPSEKDLQKGARIVALARSLTEDKTSRESDYLEAIATIYDQWDTLDHRTRVLKFEKASEKVYLKYPTDNEAAIFYALALRAAAEPKDKTFVKQRKAGEILNALFAKQPNHPGIAHYIIHTFDYPELAELGLPAARKYASIAATSAHAQHMPSHIFTRLGLWDESIQSNINSMSAAQCYAESMGIKGHWSEELHGLDYLVYAYLQKGDVNKVTEQMEYFKTINEVYPYDFRDAYSLASIPTRYALERKNWGEAAQLELRDDDFPWEKFLWEKANVNFGRLLGAVHSKQLTVAKTELEQLQIIHDKLKESKENYKANLVLIQIKAADGWIKLYEGHKAEALTLMKAAADMEDATEKHPVTPGEVIPARELLGDMYLEINESAKALEAYREDLKRHPNRFNGLYGAGLAAQKSGNVKEAIDYYNQLLSVASNSSRPELILVKSFLKDNT
ncbi:MAG TPA: tetratricopeptide repeat protein [Chryseolinea sp.]|nr:tetratricopeptide repeat protein [Chryseolinea sp.]